MKFSAGQFILSKSIYMGKEKNVIHDEKKCINLKHCFKI